MSDSQQQVLAATEQVDNDTSMAPASPISPTTNMNTDEPRQGQEEGRGSSQRQPTKTHARPRLDLSTGPGAGAAKERKRGKSMFGLVLGTLNKAKIEDKERNASEAAKKRQLIDQRLQNKLKKETDSVRRAEEAKKDKSSANRKEEELQLKHSIFKYRRTHIPQFSRFLCTADKIPSEMDDDDTAPTDPLKLPSRSHPPPIYYMPAILLPAQEAFLARRAQAVTDAVEKEWESWREECKAGIESISEMRARAKEEEDKRKAERDAQAQDDDSAAQAQGDGDAKMKEDPDTEMAVDEEGPTTAKEEDKKEVASKNDASPRPAENGVANGAAKEDATAMQADEEDAVEY